MKHSNVKTEGNVVWDRKYHNQSQHGKIPAQPGQSKTNPPSAGAQPSPSPSRLTVPHDDLPAFHVLATDEERERKAERKRPGTYGVVITPDSFADLPEYASTTPTDSSRRTSLASHQSGFALPSATSARIPLLRTRTDPNIVVLDRFEDASPTAGIPFPLPSPSRSLSIPDGLHALSINSAPIVGDSVFESPPPSAERSSDEVLFSHFRRYVVNRLIQPQLDGTNPDIVLPGATRDIFEVASIHFPPVRS